MAAKLSVVDLDSDAGEVMSRDEARALTDQINSSATALWDLVTRAYVERAWAALEYATWDAYVEAEFGNQRFALPKEERQEVVSSLRDAGLSVRAIASATGISKNTVTADLKDHVSQIGTPEPDAEVIDLGEPVEAEVEPEPAVTTGMDGKKYKRKSTPRPPTGEPKEPRPKAKSRPTVELLTAPRPEPAPEGTFAHGADIGFGDPDLGAAVVQDKVQWFAAGSYDDITPGEARFLAACLLAAADACEGGK